MPGVPAIEGELNPATWMLEITTPGMEDQLGVDFAQVYRESDLARSVWTRHLFICQNIHFQCCSILLLLMHSIVEACSKPTGIAMLSVLSVYLLE